MNKMWEMLTLRPDELAINKIAIFVIAYFINLYSKSGEHEKSL